MGYGKATVIFDVEAGLVVCHTFLVADLAADSTLLGMDFLSKYRVHVLQTGQLKAAGHSYQIVSEGERKEPSQLHAHMQWFLTLNLNLSRVTGKLRWIRQTDRRWHLLHTRGYTNLRLCLSSCAICLLFSNAWGNKYCVDCSGRPSSSSWTI